MTDSAAPMAAKEAVTAAGGGGIVGAALGFVLDPVKGMALIKWLDGSLGTVGFVLAVVAVVAIGMACVTVGVVWNRGVERENQFAGLIKEKDEQCQQEHNRQREAWKAVVDLKEAQNASQAAENAKNFKDLLVQVTRLVERTSNVPTRSRT